jgi:hypothetical protein
MVDLERAHNATLRTLIDLRADLAGVRERLGLAPLDKRHRAGAPGGGRG